MSTAAVAVFPQAATAVGGCAPDAGWPAARPDLAAQVIDLVNAHRASLGLRPLRVSATLTTAATWKARHMAAFSYLAHDDPGPPAARTAGDRLAACGYPQAPWGENIAIGYPSAQEAFDAWLASPEHRENIERADFVATGVAVAGTQEPYWAQTFGSVLDAPAPAEAAAPTAAARSSATGGALAASCAPSGQRIACHVRHARGAMLRIAVRREGRTYARALARARSDDVRVRLHQLRRLRAGRYVVVVRASAPSGTHERRLTFVARPPG